MNTSLPQRRQRIKSVTVLMVHILPWASCVCVKKEFWTWYIVWLIVQKWHTKHWFQRNDIWNFESRNTNSILDIMKQKDLVHTNLEIPRLPKVESRFPHNCKRLQLLLASFQLVTSCWNSHFYVGIHCSVLLAIAWTLIWLQVQRRKR